MLTPEQTVTLYLELSRNIHAYWAAFGAVAVLIVGVFLQGELSGAPLRVDSGLRWGLLVQLAVMVLGGLSLLTMAVSDFRRSVGRLWRPVARSCVAPRPARGGRSPRSRSSPTAG